MDRQNLFLAIAVGTLVINTGYYIWTILRKKSRPSRSSYWIWAFLGVLLLVSYVAGGGTNWYVAAINTACNALVALFSLRYGEGKTLNKWDRRAIALAVTSLPLWIGFRFFATSADAALLAFGVQMFADAAAGMPMLEKCWNRPESEARSAWVVGTVVYGVNLLAVREWTPQDVIWNVWIGGVCLAVTLTLFFRPRSDAVLSQAQ